MTRASPIITNFNAGELSPRMDGRVDVEKYHAGAHKMENAVPLIQGGCTKRSGTRFVAEVKNDATFTRLIPFEFNITQAYVIEAGNLYFRFYTNNGRIETAPGVAYEVATPYTTADLATLTYVQSNDVLYIAHPNYAPRKLSRTSAVTFALAAIDFQNGPFKDENIVQATTVYASADTGPGITVTASSAIFQAAHVGSILQIAQVDWSSIKAWEPAKTVVAGDLRRSDGKAYYTAAGGTTGAVQPIHFEGSAIDGDPGVKWDFRHSGFGYVKITGFTSSTVVTADVIVRLPQSVIGVGNPTYRWSLGAWSAVEGYPAAVAILSERLSYGKANTIYSSVVADYENFAAKTKSGLVTADRAMRVTVSSDKVDLIRWMLPDRVLVAGSAGGEMIADAVSRNDAIGPANVKIVPQSKFGSAPIRPVQIGAAVIFVQRAGLKIREMQYDFNSDRYQAPDITVLADHITAPGVTDLAYQQEPDSLIWAVRADGQLLSCTYSPGQDVRGWSRHIIGGYSDAGRTLAARVESITSIPDPSGNADQLWMVVQRTINGVVKRYVEYLAPLWLLGTAPADAFFVDCGATYSGAPATTISSLGYLEGETVDILADGATHATKVVTGGLITLDRSASKVQVGLHYEALLTTMRIEAGSANGTAQGKIKRINKVAFRFFQTLGVTAGPENGPYDDVILRTSADPMDNAPALFDGDKLMNWPGIYEFEGRITVKSSQPLPWTLLAIMPSLETQDR